ncbi:MAG TPA: hypothetical protein PLY87_10180 [Planctomycetaceae bacterium]|nr:hypothetical protein [Planctomycetaceae bacterium]HQZ65434.1 hypothetical protein [Planctomycetaceae bacterium]
MRKSWGIIWRAVGVSPPSYTHLTRRAYAAPLAGFAATRDVTSWNVWQTMLFLVLMQFAIVTDGLLYGFFHSDPTTRRLTQWCSFLVSFAICGVLVVIGAALILPLGKLVNDLS